MERGLRRYLATATCARLADDGMAVAVTLLALHRTGSAAQGAAVLAAWMAPHAVAAPLTGALAARAGARTGADGGADGGGGGGAGAAFHAGALGVFAAAIAGVALTLGRAPVPVVLAVAALGGCCGPMVTGGLSSVLAGLVPGTAARARAYALDAATYNAAGIAAPAAVTAAAGLWGAGPAAAALAASAAAAAGLATTLRMPRPGGEAAVGEREVGEGEVGEVAVSAASGAGAGAGAGAGKGAAVGEESEPAAGGRPPLHGEAGPGTASVGGRPAEGGHHRRRPGGADGAPAARVDPDARAVTRPVGEDLAVGGGPVPAGGDPVPTDGDSASAGGGSGGRPRACGVDDGSVPVAGRGPSTSGGERAPTRGRPGPWRRLRPLRARGAVSRRNRRSGLRPTPRSRPPARLRRELLGGMRVLWRVPALRRITGATSLAFVGVGGLAPAAVLLADERGYPGGGGVLLTVLAAGALAGALGAARRPPGLSDARLAAACLVGTGAALLGAAAAGPYPLCVALFGVAGLCDGPLLAATLRIRADHAPPAVRTQVFTLGAGLKTTAGAGGAALTAAAASALAPAQLLAALAALQLAGASLLRGGAPRPARAGRAERGA
ncbi:hypothetical protein [Streptomyces sp. MAR4 CNX-425]|uniref:hypothetical protein n=1 Tax=Streptomyces sp. MAR4 CNX-425 TaxID=3406343 RepID=UPI003B50C411